MRRDAFRSYPEGVSRFFKELAWGIWSLLECDDICTSTTIWMNVEKVLEIIIVICSIDDGNAVDLGISSKESSAIAILLNGMTDV